MSKIKLLIVFFVLMLTFSCKEKETESPVTWSLTPSGEKIQLPLDDSTSNVSMGLEYFQSEKPLLFNSNRNNNSLQIYDLDGQTLVKEIRFEREGDQGTALGHFHVQSLDSIFIFPEMSPFIILTDTSGTIKSRIRFSLPEGYPMIFVHNSYYVSPPVVRGKELIVKVRLDGNPSSINQEALDGKKLLAAINLEDGSTRLLPFGFPKDYLSNGQKQFEFSVAGNHGKTVASYMGDHQVYFSNSENEPMQPKSAKSQYLDETMPTFPKDVDGRGFSAYFFAKSRYESLIHDPYRNVYYRFAYPTVVAETDEELRALRASPGPFVVMVLDEDLNVLAETKFDSGTYLPSNFFVGEKGLYLSLSHPDNPANQEDQFAFELIQLKE
ncbi:DUF4221 family protein [Algoriphagus terrigena]|uniref:DUF4221 family protein n=1 Tax=Algoriphagus terrigena TaxID=344884 RepID=UPI0004197D8E|nr:DUF4221 family protein [Algoriphagus terrigena]